MYTVYVLLVLCIWLGYMSKTDSWYLLKTNFQIIITMVFGAFIAGSSPEGSSAIAYPIFTILLDISPNDARNFAFAIQSIGMTAASIFILSKKIKVDWNYIKIVTPSGALGLIVGMYLVAPNIEASTAKLSFVSLWFAFGLIMIRENLTKVRNTKDVLLIQKSNDLILLLVAGFIGGVVSSIFGTGINMLTFCILVVFFNINEKVATPSSIIIMTIETIIGFTWHAFIFSDISDKSYTMWLSAIPFVIFFAPLGTYLMYKMRNLIYNYFLYIIFIIQYFGAIIVLRPSNSKLLLSFGIILVSLLLFWLLLKQSESTKRSEV